MEAANSMRPLPAFDYVTTTSYEPSHRHAPTRSHCRSDTVREAAHPDKGRRSRGKNRDRSVGVDALQSVKSTTSSMSYAPINDIQLGLRNSSKYQSPETRGPTLYLPHNGPLVVEMKVASAIIRRILIDTRRLVDIITWDCLKKLKHIRREIARLEHPILGFGGQECHSGWLTLHKVKAVTASYLFQLQFEADDGSITTSASGR
ncbi:hypothetical protein Cgig2_016074 [Carnegiea gigantea]|uniref:Uncharacterized protein n=1 Tax=Carnegiea gigantea TaxID=171969 RepID=A0A9Q1JU47_9CARY|nr:hypothetical protein Cgig2_016074 [Carnegiea gigantea]